MKITYVGPHTAVEVAGRVVRRGESEEFPADLARSLTARPDFEEAKPAKKNQDEE